MGREELESIRYIRCFYEREGGENFNAIAYSFTDYRDCDSEEEFFETVKKWTYRMKSVSWPSDFTMLTGADPHRQQRRSMDVSSVLCPR